MSSLPDPTAHVPMKHRHQHIASCVGCRRWLAFALAPTPTLFCLKCHRARLLGITTSARVRKEAARTRTERPLFPDLDPPPSAA